MALLRHLLLARKDLLVVIMLVGSPCDIKVEATRDFLEILIFDTTKSIFLIRSFLRNMIQTELELSDWRFIEMVKSYTRNKNK
jgi:hypothetical protein